MSDGRQQAGRVALSVQASFLAGPHASVVVCPFLARADDSGGLGEPGHSYDEAHRCTAYGPRLPLGRSQQELVCLTAEYTSCPRYLRGVRFGPAGPRQSRLRTGAPLAAIGLLAVLAAGAVLAGAAFALGPLAFLAGGPTPATPGPTAVPPTAPVTAAPTLAVTPSPVASVSPLASPTAVPLPTPPPGSPYATLAPCPDGGYCYIYTVVSGDTLYAIAGRFGTTVSAIRALNPEIGSGSVIHPGEKLKLPPPS